MIEVVVSHGDNYRCFPPPADPVSIGSATSNDWVLPFPGVSRRHGLAEWRDGALHLRDTGSKNRFVVEGVAVAEVTVQLGEQVWLGRALLRLVERVEVVVPLGLDSASTFATPGSTSEVPQRATEPRRQALQLVRDLVAGVSGDGSARLGDLRRLIGAKCVLALGRLDRTILPLRAVAGDVPSDADAVALVEAASRGALRAAAADGTWLVGHTGAEEVPVLAALVPAGRAIEDWEELVLIACGQAIFGTRPSGERVQSAVDGDPLRYPEEMVVGHSAVFRRLLNDLRATLGADRVLLLGETGCGKDLFARLLHASGPFSAGPFVACNLAALPADQLEAELFGIVAGAATGVSARKGLFAEAEGGTLFLDEIGELPLPLQAKLLRVLQNREVRAIGQKAEGARRINLRIVSATNRDLEGGGDRGFRLDLYHRLALIVHRIPALRERAGDIPDLALRMLERLAREKGRRPRGISLATLQFLAALPWPGNVRQLENELTRALLVCPNGDTLRREHFSVELSSAVETPSPASGGSWQPSFEERRNDHERRELLEALESSGGRMGEAARLLGISRQGLYQRRRRLGLLR